MDMGPQPPKEIADYQTPEEVYAVLRAKRTITNREGVVYEAEGQILAMQNFIEGVKGWYPRNITDADGLRDVAMKFFRQKHQPKNPEDPK